tara:strand:+ start:250 stop:453 length:204 start_codon:yes stop_codon:yes gene_type:complete
MKLKDELYNIYVKAKGMKRFRPIDLKNNKPVVNLIHASLLNSDDAYKVLLDLRAHNPTMEFKKVRIK